MFLKFLATGDFFSNKVDIVFFSAIGVILVLIIAVFVASKIVQIQKDKKYAAQEENLKRQEQEIATAQEEKASEEDEVPVEENAEQTSTEEVVEEPKEENIEQPTVVEEPAKEQVVEDDVAKEEDIPGVENKDEEPKAVEEKKSPAKKTTPKKEPKAAEEKKTPAKKTTPKKEPKAAEEKKSPAKKTTSKAEPKVAEEKKSPAKKATPKAEPKVVEEKKSPVKKTVTKTTDASKSKAYSGKYEVYPSGDGYQYRLKASNGEVLVVSEVYTTKDSAMKAIDAVKRNVEIGEIRIFKDKRGLYKFKLTSKNYRVLALSSSYSTEKGAVRSSESFKNFALKANIVEIETPVDQDNIVEPYLDISKVEEKTGGKYVVEKFDGEFSWDLKASNGQILCQAEGYTSKSGALSSIESFKKNVETGSFKILKDKNNNFHYNLYTASGRLATVGETYNSKQLAESAALSVVSYFKNAEIEG